MDTFLPFWLKEIVEKEKELEKFILFEDDTSYAFLSKNSTQILKFKKIGGSKTTKNNKKVAFFRDGPFLPASTGAVTSILGEMEALADRGYDVYLFYCFRGWSDPRLYKNQKFSTVFIKPSDFYSNEKLIPSLLKKYGIYIAQLDSAESVVVQEKLIRPESKLVFEVHNVEYDLLSQLNSPTKEIDTIKIAEIDAIKKSDLILLRSQQNLEMLQKLSGKIHNSKIYRGCINVDQVKFNLKKDVLNKKILFLGHLNYAPNIQALEEIFTKILPHVNAEFLIAGSGYDKLFAKYKNKKLNFLGRVDDLSSLFSSVDIALAPLITGSGTRLKILDYMAGGVPVIGTHLSVEGLEKTIKQAMIVEDDITMYPAIINDLLSNPKKIEFLSRAGRNYVSKYRDWKVCIEDIINAYDTLGTR